MTGVGFSNVTVVVPTHNERGNQPRLVSIFACRCRKAMPPGDIRG